MRRGLKRLGEQLQAVRNATPRARPPMRRGLKQEQGPSGLRPARAARAAPYEKGTETQAVGSTLTGSVKPRARPPMRRGLKPKFRQGTVIIYLRAARAAPYEKGTETSGGNRSLGETMSAARAAPYEKGTETLIICLVDVLHFIAARAAPYEKGTETNNHKRGNVELRRRARGPL